MGEFKISKNDAFIKLKPFHFWCQKVLPLVYDDSLSYYEVLCKLTELLNIVIQNEDYLFTVTEGNNEDIESLKKLFGELQDELEAIKNGKYMSLYIEALASWINNNLQEIVQKIVKQVFFGLTQDGHFAAYIPPAWDFVHFDTVVVPESPLYGHLLLRY